MELALCAQVLAVSFPSLVSPQYRQQGADGGRSGTATSQNPMLAERREARQAGF